MADSDDEKTSPSKTHMAAVTALSLLLGAKTAQGAGGSQLVDEACEALTQARTLDTHVSSNPFAASSKDDEGNAERPKDNDEKGKGDHNVPEHGSHSSHSSHASHHSSHER